MLKTVIKNIWILLFLATLASCSDNAVEAVWYEGKPHTIVIRNLPRTGEGWTVWFSTPALKNLVMDPSSTAELVEVEGNFYRIVPKTAVWAKGDSAVVRYSVSNKMYFRASVPEGLSFQKGFGKPRAIHTQYVYKDLEPDAANDAATQAQVSWNQFADTMTGPVTRIAREDRYALLKKVLVELPENDRIILEMRHFDGLGNQECANLLKIEPKAASIRYVRALQRLRQKLTEYTEFSP